MKKLFSALVALLILTAPAQAQEESTQEELRALADAFAPYVDAFKQMAAALTGFQPLPACATLDNDNLHVARLDEAVTRGAVFCREIAHDGSYRINPGVIGSQSVIERGVQQAYDIFGMTVEGVAVQQFNDPITVCLKGRGALVFLPAFASPRPTQSPQSYPSGDFTCASLGSSGIIALVSG